MKIRFLGLLLFLMLLVVGCIPEPPIVNTPVASPTGIGYPPPVDTPIPTNPYPYPGDTPERLRSIDRLAIEVYAEEPNIVPYVFENGLTLFLPDNTEDHFGQTMKPSAKDDLYVDVHCTHDIPVQDNTVVGRCTMEGAPEDAVISGVEVYARVAHECMSDLTLNVYKDSIFANVWPRNIHICPLDMGWDDDPENDGDLELFGRYTDNFNGLPINGEFLFEVVDAFHFSYGTLTRSAYRVFYVTDVSINVLPSHLTFTYDLPNQTSVQKVKDYTVLKSKASDGKVRVVVETKPGTFSAQSAKGVEVKTSLNYGFAAVVETEGLNNLINDPNVLSVVPDIRVQAIPIEEFDEEVEIKLNQSSALIHAREVHALGFTGKGVTVAVIDTGIDTDHPDLEDDLKGQRCYGTCPGGPNSAEDDEGHGTSVSGIITGEGINNIAPLGIAPDAGIYAIKVLDSQGGGWMSDIEKGIEWATARASEYNIRAINMSLGGGGWFESSCDNQMPTMAQAITAAKNAGIAVFVASGNEFSTQGISVPACMSDSISVGAVWDQGFGGNPCERDKKADEVVCYSNAGRNLDMLLPLANSTTYLNGGETNNFGGTSAATPHAAAVAALLLQYNPYLDSYLVENVMELSGIPRIDWRTGREFPRVDALRAIQFSGINISNRGSGELVISNISIENNSCWLGISANTPISLLPYQTVHLPIAITQCVGRGNYVDTLLIESNDPLFPTTRVQVSLVVTGEGEPLPSPTPTETVEPTETQEPTETPIPTNTVEPSPTATGTLEPSPTPEVTPEPSCEIVGIIVKYRDGREVEFIACFSRFLPQILNTGE